MKKLFITVFLTLLVFSIAAQDRLSLSKAIELGLQRNFDIQIEKKNVIVNQNNNNWGEAGRWPNISLQMGQNNNVSDVVEPTSPFQLQGATISNSLSPSVNVNWTVFDGFKVNISKRRLEQLEAESQGNASIVVANTIQAIILGYYNLVFQYERLTELEKQLNLSRDKLDYLEVKSELGSAVSADLLIEEGNYLTDSLNFINQRLTARNALRNLNLLLAEEDPEKQYILTDELEDETGDYAYADLREKMFSNNVDLSKQYITQAILGTNVSLAKADRMPTLAFNGGVTENRSRVDLSNATFQDGSQPQGAEEPLTGITDNYFANFTLSFTLFNGGRINRAIKNAIVQEDIGDLRVERMKLSLDRDLKEALDLYNVRKQIYQINLRREEVARTNLDLSEEKFKNGSINSFDYRVVQNNYLSSAITRLQALYSLIESKIALMRLTGGLIKDYGSVQ